MSLFGPVFFVTFRSGLLCHAMLSHAMLELCYAMLSDSRSRLWEVFGFSFALVLALALILGPGIEATWKIIFRNKVTHDRGSLFLMEGCLAGPSWVIFCGSLAGHSWLILMWVTSARKLLPAITAIASLP